MMTNPYPGLRPFHSNESHLFFGRDGQADAILTLLKEQRFVAVVGVSGCGKSSLLNAGVFPGLHGGLLAGGQREWRIVTMRPRDQPLRSLACALAAGGGVMDQGEETASLAESVLRHSSGGLANLVRGRSAGEDPQAFAMLIVVDQFEELFRFSRTGSPEEAAHFVQLLIEAVNQSRSGSAGDSMPPLPLYVMLAMRSDFLGDCAVFPGLPELINRAQYLVPRMSLRQREAAIARPATTEGTRIGRPLLDRLLDDMGDKPDQLPVLQHALQRTWDVWWQRTGGEGDVALEDYRTVGGMAGAINEHAGKAFATLNVRRQRLAAVLFRCITERAENGRYIRRPLALKTIAEIAQVPVEEMCPVIDAFRTQQRSFLMPPESEALKPDDLIDISHESLIHNWPRLLEWARHEAAAVNELLRLKQSSGAYLQKDQDHLRRLELSRVQRWQEGLPPEEPFAGQKRRRTLPGAIPPAPLEPEVKPSVAWARLYLVDEAAVVFAQIENFIRESARLVRRESARWQAVGALFAILLMSSILTLGLQYHKEAALAGELALESGRRKQALETFGKSVEPLSRPVLRNSQEALTKLEKQAAKMTAAIEKAAVELPPDKTAIAELNDAYRAVDQARDDMNDMVRGFQATAEGTEDAGLFAAIDKLRQEVAEIGVDRVYKEYSDNALDAVTPAVVQRLDNATMALGELMNQERPDLALVQQKEDAILKATAEYAAVEAIEDAALAFKGLELSPDGRYYDDVLRPKGDLLRTFEAINEMKRVASVGLQLTEWQKNKALSLPHSGRVLRVRFVPSVANASLWIVTSSEVDKKGLLSFWNHGAQLLEEKAGDNLINDIDFSPKGNAFVTASNGNTVRYYTWQGAYDLSTLKVSA
ncbi:MAG: hypothetical protein U0984_07655, partial [Prosthecobacter sp.]|nr:hypothetical protein [Prosthecobacter sp.]